MRELSDETLDVLDSVLARALHKTNRYNNVWGWSANTYRAALAEFRAWREYMAQRRSFAAANVAIDRAEREAREATEPTFVGPESSPFTPAMMEALREIKPQDAAAGWGPFGPPQLLIVNDDEKATEPNPFAAAFGAFPDLPLPGEEATEPGCETCGGEGLTHRAGTRRIDRETCLDCKGTGKRKGGTHG